MPALPPPKYITGKRRKLILRNNGVLELSTKDKIGYWIESYITIPVIRWWLNKGAKP